jgi:EmrB/QacA subfamily drug resistance transporter
MRKWWPLVAVSLGTLMLLVDVTIVNVALPNMALDLKTSFSSLQWVVDIYALALAALLLSAGTISDRLGHRRIYIVGLVLFAAASLASGIAPNDGLLVVARGIQGIGGAAMFATTFALLNTSYQGRDRGTAYGIWGAVGGASAAIGPVLGGVLTQELSWRWIFFVNVPVSALTVGMCLAALKADHADPGHTRRLDPAGMLSFSLAAGGLTYGLILAGEHGWSDTAAIVWFIVAAIALIVFVVVESRIAQPMLELQLLRNRIFTGSLIAGLVLSLAAFSGLVYTSIWLQSVKGLGPIAAGLGGGLALSSAAFVTSGAVGRFLHGARAGAAIGIGLGLIGIGDVVQAVQLHGNASWPALTFGLILVGIGVGGAIPVLSSTAMSSVPLERGGMAAGAVNTGRQLGLAIGIAVLGTIFTTRIAQHFSDAGVPDADRLAHAVAGGQSKQVLAGLTGAQRSALSTAVHEATVSALSTVLLVAGIVVLIAAVLVGYLVRPGRPADEPGEPTKPAGPKVESAPV